MFDPVLEVIVLANLLLIVAIAWQLLRARKLYRQYRSRRGVAIEAVSRGTGLKRRQASKLIKFSSHN